MGEVSPLGKGMRSNSHFVSKRKRSMGDTERKESSTNSMVTVETRATASMTPSSPLSLPPPFRVLNSSFTPATSCGYCALYSIPEKFFYLFLRHAQTTRFIEQCENVSSSFSLLECTREILPPSMHLKAHSDHLWWCSQEMTQDDENENCHTREKIRKDSFRSHPDECVSHGTLSGAEWPPSPSSMPLFTPFSLFQANRPVFLFFLSTPLLPSALSSSPSFSLPFSCQESGIPTDASRSVVIPSHLLVLLASPFLYWSGAAWTRWKIQESAVSDGVSTPCLFRCPPFCTSVNSPSSSEFLSNPSVSSWKGKIQGQTTVCWRRVHSLRPWLLFFCQQQCHSFWKEARRYGQHSPVFSASFSPSTASISPLHPSSFRSPTHHTAAFCEYIIRQWWEPYAHPSLPLFASSPFLSISPCLPRWYDVGQSVVGDEENSPLLEGMTFLRGHPRIIIEALALTLPPTSTEAGSDAFSACPPEIHTTHSRRDGGTKDCFHLGKSGRRGASSVGAYGRMHASCETKGMCERIEEESVEAYNRRVHSHWIRLLPYVPTSVWPIIAACCGHVRTDVFVNEEESTVLLPARPHTELSSSAMPSTTSTTCSPSHHGTWVPEEGQAIPICDMLEKLLLKSCPSSLQSTHGSATTTTPLSTAQDALPDADTTVESGRAEPPFLSLPSLSVHPVPSAEDGAPHPSSSCITSQQWWAQAEDKIRFLMSLWCRVRYPEGSPYLLAPQMENGNASYTKKGGLVPSSVGNGAATSKWMSSEGSSVQEERPHDAAKRTSMECGDGGCSSSNSLSSCSPSPPYFVLPFFLLCRSLTTAVGKTALPSSRCFSSSTLTSASPFTLGSRVARNDEMKGKEITLPFFFPMLHGEGEEGFTNVVRRLALSLFPSTEELQRCQCKVEHALKSLSPL